MNFEATNATISTLRITRITVANTHLNEKSGFIILDKGWTIMGSWWLTYINSCFWFPE